MPGMRGDDQHPDSMFSYVSPEQRIPKDHPLRAIRQLVDEILRDLSRDFDRLYAKVARPSIPPERLLRAQLLQVGQAADCHSDVYHGVLGCTDTLGESRFGDRGQRAAGHAQRRSPIYYSLYDRWFDSDDELDGVHDSFRRDSSNGG
jgi:hypothetical protein